MPKPPTKGALSLLRKMLRASDDAAYATRYLNSEYRDPSAALRTAARPTAQLVEQLMDEGYRGPTLIRMAPESYQIPPDARVKKEFVGTHYVPSSMLSEDIAQAQIRGVLGNMTGWADPEQFVVGRYVTNVPTSSLINLSDDAASGDLHAMLTKVYGKSKADSVMNELDFNDYAKLQANTRNEFVNWLEQRGALGATYHNTGDEAPGGQDIGRSLMLLNPRNHVRRFYAGGLAALR